MTPPARAVMPATRRGACPALTAPMQTGDGLLVRLNLAEGGLSPATLAALCEAAQVHGNGLVEITARGSFQVRGLTLASARLFADSVNALAIPVREGVPVETSPLAGLDPSETADPLPLVRLIRTAVEAAGLTPRLGPKVSVVVDGVGQVSLEGVAADVRVKAISQRDWLVSVAGAPQEAVEGDDNAVAAVLRLLAEIANLGTAARGRDVEAYRAAGRPVVNTNLPSSVPTRFRPGILPLRADLCALAIALPLGQCESEALRLLARSAAAITDFRFAPGRRLLALGPREACAALQARAAELGFVTQSADPRLSIAACAGAPACASGHIASRKVGADAAALIAPDFVGTVHISGCAKGCAHPAAADLALVGTGEGVALVRKGRASDTAASTHTDSRSALAAMAAELQKTAA